MGKKASRKICLEYDLEESDGYFGASDHEYEADGCVPQSRSKGRSSRRAAPSKLNEKTISNVPSPSKSTDATTRNGIPAFAVNVIKSRLYHRRQLGRPFSTLLLDRGHEAVILHIASFLGLRSISAWSCTNRALDSVLANPALYCKSNSTLLLPCMKIAALSASTGIRARALALESTLFRKRGTTPSRERSLHSVLTIPHKAGSMLESKLSMYGSTVSCMSNDGEISQYKLSSYPPNTNTRNNPQGVCSSKPSHRKRFIRKDCLGDILSSFSSSRYGAVLCIPSTGLRKYVLAVTSVNSSIVSWQSDIQPSILASVGGRISSLAVCSSMTGRRHCVKIDAMNRWVIVVFRNYLLVFSLQKGELLWNIVLSKEHQDWLVWTIHDHYIVALTANQRQLLMYCLDRQCLVASGRIPFKKGGESLSGSDSFSAPALVVYGKRVWFTKQRILYCTGCILRRLDRSKEDSKTSEAPPQLQIKRFNEVDVLNADTSILQVFDGTLFLTNGNLIKIYQDNSVIDHSIGKSLESTIKIEPSHVLCTEGSITFLQADSTKIICGIRDDKKNRIEVLLRPEVASDNTAFYHSVFIKNATVFCDRYDFQNIEFRGGRLLVEFAKSSDGAGYYANGVQHSQQSELRLYDLFDWDE